MCGPSDGASRAGLRTKFEPAGPRPAGRRAHAAHAAREATMFHIIARWAPRCPPRPRSARGRRTGRRWSLAPPRHRPHGSDAHPRRPHARPLAAPLAERPDEASRRIDLEHLTRRLDGVRMADEDLAPAVRVDGRALAPPRGPAGGVGEVAEHDVPACADDDAAIERVRQGRQGRSSPPGRRSRRRRWGCGPRRASSSSARSVSRYSASLPRASSAVANGPSASRRARQRHRRPTRRTATSPPRRAPAGAAQRRRT